MTEDGRFDSRLAIALQESFAAPEMRETVAGRERGVERGARRRRRRRVVLPAAIAAAVLATVGIVPWALGLFDDQRPTRNVETAAAPIVGEVWRRDVTGGGQKGWQGTWTLLLKPDGALVLSMPPGLRGVGTDGNSWRIEGSTLRVDAFVGGPCSDLPPGTYAWRRSGGALVLSVVQDTCQARAAVFDGPWSAVGANR